MICGTRTDCARQLTTFNHADLPRHHPGSGLALRPGGCEISRLSAGRMAITLARVRLTDFRERMRKQFGDSYADSVAQDYVLDALSGRTVNQALADGEDAKIVWSAVCEAFRVPEKMR